MLLWRLVKSRYADSAFDGEGARLYGARWSSPGTRVAYAASSSALAVLEVLVHLGDVTMLPRYSLIQATVPDGLVELLSSSALPPGWDSSPVPPYVQAVGDAWVRSGRALALSVPSAIVPGGFNVLLNPAHSLFGRVVINSMEPFRFDARLLR